MGMGKKGNITCAVICVALLVCSATWSSATTIDLGVDQFAVLSGGNFSAGDGVHITGQLGAVGDILLSGDASFIGDVYSTGSFQAEGGVSISNRLVIADDVWLEADAASVGSVHAGGSVTVGRSGTIDLIAAVNSIIMRRDTVVTGDVASSADVTIDRNSTVYGDVTYGTTLSVHPSVDIYGTTTLGSATPDQWNAVVRTNPGLSTTGSDDIHYASGTDNTLPAGDYADLSLDSNATVRLDAGTYNFDSLLLGTAAHLIADTSDGDVIINVVGTLSTERDAVFERIGDGHTIIQTGQDISLGRGNTADAHFRSFAALSVARDTTVTGSLYSSGDMTFDRSVSVTGGALLPEPATVALLIIGALTIITHHRQSLVRLLS